MTEDDDAFIRTIVDNPCADLPRLVYADWLDEQGDPKLAILAEYIRLEVEWHPLKSDSEQCRNLGRRREELFKLAGGSIRPPLPTWARKNSRRVTLLTARGLPHSLECTLKQFARGGTVLEYAPIVEVRLGDTHYLDGRDLPADAPFAAAALARKELIRVRDLSVYGPLGDDAFAALAANPNVSNIRKLELHDLTTLSEASAAALASAALRLAKLRELSLSFEYPYRYYPDHARDTLLDAFDYPCDLSINNSRVTRSFEELGIDYYGPGFGSG